jgi:hypothetical protein
MFDWIVYGLIQKYYLYKLKFLIWVSQVPASGQKFLHLARGIVKELLC